MDKVIVTELTKYFGDFRAVNKVSFTIKDNEFFSLLGPSGCGKTTTLRCIAGLESPYAGKIQIGSNTVFDGEHHIDIPPNRRKLGMVFQNYAVWPHMTVFNNIAYPLRILKKDRKEIEQTVSRVMNTLGIGELGKRKPHELSGGQQQRVALGRSLAMEPAVLLLDEPLSNLDAKLREEMRVELKSIQRKTGIAILYVTHDQLEAMAMSDRIAVMSNGDILQCASPPEIYNNPVNQEIFEFIGMTNHMDCTIENAEQKTVKVKIGGTAVTVPRPVNMPDGKHIQLGVRPEDIVLSPFKDSVTGVLTGTIEIFLYLGNINEYRVRVGNELLQVHTHKTERFNVGDKVDISFSDVKLWDKET